MFKKLALAAVCLTCLNTFADENDIVLTLGDEISGATDTALKNIAGFREISLKNRMFNRGGVVPTHISAFVNEKNVIEGIRIAYPSPVFDVRQLKGRYTKTYERTFNRDSEVEYREAPNGASFVRVITKGNGETEILYGTGRWFYQYDSACKQAETVKALRELFARKNNCDVLPCRETEDRPAELRRDHHRHMPPPCLDRDDETHRRMHRDGLLPPPCEETHRQGLAHADTFQEKHPCYKMGPRKDLITHNGEQGENDIQIEINEPDSVFQSHDLDVEHKMPSLFDNSFLNLKDFFNFGGFKDFDKRMEKFGKDMDDFGKEMDDFGEKMDRLGNELDKSDEQGNSENRVEKSHSFVRSYSSNNGDVKTYHAENRYSKNGDTEEWYNDDNGKITKVKRTPYGKHTIKIDENGNGTETDESGHVHEIHSGENTDNNSNDLVVL